MHKSKGSSKGSKKRKHEDEYDLQTILEDDASNDGDIAEPRAAARNAEKNDEAVKYFTILTNFCVDYELITFRLSKTNMERRIIEVSWN